MHDNFDDCNQPVQVCELNEYHRNGSCVECPAGPYCDGIARRDCDVGYFCPGNSIRMPCSAGRFGIRTNETSEMSACQKCERGKWQPRKGQDACHNVCPNGKYATDHKGAASQQEACKDCEKGSYCMFGSAFLCPRGKYNNESGSVDMNACKHVGLAVTTTRAGQIQHSNVSLAVSQTLGLH